MVSMTIKGMQWIENYKAVVNNTKFLPPIGVALDVTDRCNLNCYWCNAEKFRSTNMLSTNHVKRIIDMLSSWEVKSICFAGGGEPTLHRNLAELITYAGQNSLEVALSTNGINLTDDIVKALSKYSRFIGFSVDAAKEDTWKKMKGSNDFKKVILNIAILALELKYRKTDLTYKVLVTPENQYEIVDACRLAKELGCKSFFARPVVIEDLPNKSFNIITIAHELKVCESLATENFKVYTNFGRVNEDYSKRNSFDRCYASVVLPVLCADGYVYICVDHRQDKKYRLCKHLELRDYWGSKKHRELIANVKPKECSRCTLGNYNEQAEAYFKDTIFKNFP